MDCHCAGVGRVFQRRFCAGNEGEVIPVPYVSQIDNAPRHNECGLACVLMLARWNGKGMANTVTELSQKYDAPDDGTTPANLVLALKDFGLTGIPKAAQYPYIELVYYAKLPFKLDPNGTFLHWIVRLSDTEYHDPYWRGSAGANLKTTKAMLDAAEVTANSRVGIVERPSEPTMTKATVITEVRVRIGPEVSDATWTPLALKEGQVLDGVVQGDFFKYADSRFVVYNKAGQRVDALYSAIKHNGIQYLAVASDPPTTPPPPSAFKLGVSVLHAHHLLEPAYQAGIRCFLVMDGVLAAVQFKRAHPDAIVMYRRFLDHGAGIPNPSAFSAEAALGNGIVFVSPLNECDNWCYGSPGEIQARAMFDTQLAAMCKANGTIYAGGGFSMGTPDFTRQDICDAMRKFYAPHYNSGLMALNMHLYSPNANHINSPLEWIWYERRWQFLFDKCGFDPSPNLLGIYCDETGVDEGGVGGFPAHGMGCEAIRQWGAAFVAAQRQGLGSFPSPVRGAAIFQAGDTGRWGGYNVQGCFDAIAKANA